MLCFCAVSCVRWAGMLEAGSRPATQNLKASNLNHALFLNSNARARVCVVCVCLQVDCQLIDTAPEHDDHDHDMGLGAAMDGKEGIVGEVVPCCPVCVVVDGARAARNLSHSRRALAHTIVNRRSIVYRSNLHATQRGSCIWGGGFSYVSCMHAWAPCAQVKVKRGIVRRFVGIDPPFDKFVKNPERWFKEKSVRVSALTEKKVLDAVTHIISHKVRPLFSIAHLCEANPPHLKNLSTGTKL